VFRFFLYPDAEQFNHVNLFRVTVSLLFLSVFVFAAHVVRVQAAQVSTAYGISRQVNVAANGANIPGDAANEPTMCIDPTDPSRLAAGWRQFDTVTSDFRQSGWAYSTNGGLSWTFPGRLDPGIFRSDPVMASDANGWFYYLGITNTDFFYCDLWRSTNGGFSWDFAGQALGGDKEWMVIDTTTGPGRGNFYQLWSPFANSVGNNPFKLFTRSVDGGKTWSDPIAIPQVPYFGTLDIGPNGEVYAFGTDGDTFWVNRSTNAADRFAIPTFDLTARVDLGGQLVFGMPNINPVGLLGQAWIAVDRSDRRTRGNVYALCSVTNDPGDIANVMFSRSTDGGRTWSKAMRLNDDPSGRNACHWFGTLAVAPNGRIDACWNDTRHNPDNADSELYYSWSEDGGLTWAPNRPLSPPFNHSLGYPIQQKMGDYIAMVSLNEGACIAYSATFNGEEDIWFVRAELPVAAAIARSDQGVRISWNAVPGVTYCVQAIADLSLPWSMAATVGCLEATSGTATIDDAFGGSSPRFYRVVRQP
jgi:hypothetical protein